jgi:hypothetical protein
MDSHELAAFLAAACSQDGVEVFGTKPPVAASVPHGGQEAGAGAVEDVGLRYAESPGGLRGRDPVAVDRVTELPAGGNQLLEVIDPDGTAPVWDPRQPPVTQELTDLFLGATDTGDGLGDGEPVGLWYANSWASRAATT